MEHFIISYMDQPVEPVEPDILVSTDTPVPKVDVNCQCQALKLSSCQAVKLKLQSELCCP